MRQLIDKLNLVDLTVGYGMSASQRLVPSVVSCFADNIYDG